MYSISVLEAKSSLSRLVEVVESGAEQEIIIARDGRPAARLVPLSTRPAAARIGVAKGSIEAPDDIDVCNPEVAALFGRTGGA